MRLTPPLPAIEALLIAAESDSLRDAARRLALSPSALSRRIRSLEAYLGQELFDRRHNGFALTPEGAAYLADIRGPIDRIRQSTRDARCRKGARPIRLMASHSLSTGWLSKRLVAFESDNPEVEIDLVMGHTMADFKRAGADIGFMSNTWPMDGCRFTPVIHLDAIAVSARSLADGTAAPQTLADIHAAPRLAVRDPEDLWSKWWSAAGGTPGLTRDAKSYQTIMLSLEAATTGSGVTLGIAPHVTRYLDAGTLVRCTGTVVAFDRHYGIVRRDSAALERPELRRLADWLGHEGCMAEQAFRQFL